MNARVRELGLSDHEIRNHQERNRLWRRRTALLAATAGCGGLGIVPTGVTSFRAPFVFTSEPALNAR